MENNGTNMVMPVGPYYGSGNGDGMFGGNGAWWLLILLIALGGWGNGFGMGGFGGGFGAWGMEGLYPWMNQSNQINNGFRDQMLGSQVMGLQNSVTAGFGDVQNSLCGGFAGVNANINNGFAQAEISENARQMANMQQMFGIQTALQNCCCENRLATANQTATILSENCADRAALAEGVRDIIAAQTAGIQSIKDQLCQDKIDEKNDLIAQLRQEVLYARGQVAQDVQTATLRAGQATTANQLLTELRNCPIPAMPVYGQTPIFTCGGNACGTNCGCGVA